MSELQRLLLQNAAFTPPRRIVQDIPVTARTARPCGSSHSVAEELWHVVYWQDHFLRWAQMEPLPYPAHSAEGWRVIGAKVGPTSEEALTDSEWDDLVARFLRGLDEAGEIAGATDLSTRDSTLEDSTSDAGFLNVLEVIVNLAVHNAYHLGRIVQLRQMLGCWPPQEGGDTW